jgi:hypothetical protein
MANDVTTVIKQFASDLTIGNTAFDLFFKSFDVGMVANVICHSRGAFVFDKHILLLHVYHSLHCFAFTLFSGHGIGTYNTYKSCQMCIIRSHEMQSVQCDLMILTCQWDMIWLFGSGYYCSIDKFIIYPQNEWEIVQYFDLMGNKLFQMIMNTNKYRIFCTCCFHCATFDLFNKKHSLYAFWRHHFQRVMLRSIIGFREHWCGIRKKQCSTSDLVMRSDSRNVLYQNIYM